ncbi:glycosyltransferase [Akkermansiaceae bacterium]|nr:glycosyltransferase [Akkermansiaceae bacterium]MDB4282198.1 glycosyltransferase [Akkermansiaceae bacterium]MDB4804614.1 glycosyltransferase [Akkermansiaceae bacterium]MDC0286834.1 glycosyltransferase [Akkermansiaceae bacterium]
MKVLICAYACEPGRGAEPGVGWNIVKGLSQNHELWVVTRSDNQEVIEFCNEKWVSDVSWIYHDPPKLITFWKKGRKGLMLFYLIWLWTCLFKVQKLNKTVKFDRLHHLTFGSIVPASPLALLGVPLVVGPLGGAENPPEAFLESMPFRQRAHVFKRTALHWIARKVFVASWFYRRTHCAIGATPQAAALLSQLGAPRVVVQVQSGMGKDEIEKFTPTTKRETSEVLRLVSACRLIHWKAVDLTIDALAQAIREGGLARLDVFEMGPEMDKLQSRVSDLGLEEHVTFHGRVPHLNQVYEAISQADALVHPALHEAFGQVCLESLALGTPVIALNWAGPGQLINKSCGYPIPVGSRDEVVAGIAAAILDCQERPEEHRKKRDAARQQAGNFSWFRVVDTVEKSYLYGLKRE